MDHHRHRHRRHRHHHQQQNHHHHLLHHHHHHHHRHHHHHVLHHHRHHHHPLLGHTFSTACCAYATIDADAPDRYAAMPVCFIELFLETELLLPFRQGLLQAKALLLPAACSVCHLLCAFLPLLHVRMASLGLPWAPVSLVLATMT